MKKELENMHDALRELEGHARKLPNQNFADVVESARGKVKQLVEHPDLDAVSKEAHPEVAAAGTPVPFTTT